MPGDRGSRPTQAKQFWRLNLNRKKAGHRGTHVYGVTTDRVQDMESVLVSIKS